MYSSLNILGPLLFLQGWYLLSMNFSWGIMPRQKTIIPVNCTKTNTTSDRPPIKESKKEEEKGKLG